jgi:predicted DNA-binding protein with PD1-like motif
MLEVSVMKLSVTLVKIEMFCVIHSLSEGRSVYVSPAEPRYYEFQFKDNIETVLLRVDSDDDICMTVSIQNMSVSYVVM